MLFDGSILGRDAAVIIFITLKHSTNFTSVHMLYGFDTSILAADCPFLLSRLHSLYGPYTSSLPLFKFLPLLIVHFQSSVISYSGAIVGMY